MDTNLPSSSWQLVDQFIYKIHVVKKRVIHNYTYSFILFKQFFKFDEL